jgi:hypothetical protein
LQQGDPKDEKWLDRGISPAYFVFDCLQSFDLPDLLAAYGTRGLAVDPIDGDWHIMNAEAAHRLLPRQVRPAYSHELEILLRKFFDELAPVGDGTVVTIVMVLVQVGQADSKSESVRGYLFPVPASIT